MTAPKTAEERKETRRAANARYYERHKERILERTRAYQATHGKPAPRPYASVAADRRTRENGRRLEDLKEAIHPSIQPVVATLQSIGAAKALYRNEVRALEDILTLVSAKWEESDYSEETPAPPAPPPTGPKPKHPPNRFQ
jgi:hypothetical protein